VCVPIRNPGSNIIIENYLFLSFSTEDERLIHRLNALYVCAAAAAAHIEWYNDYPGLGKYKKKKKREC
jgi:hypothetical protein